MPILSSIHSYFPLERERPVQTEALDRIQDWLQGDKRFFLAEMPTGSGKSAISIAATRYMGSGYVISPQKSLVAQYMQDFSHLGLQELRGAANYLCAEGLDCEAMTILSGRDWHEKHCIGYFPAKRAFMGAEIGVTNFSFFLRYQSEREPLWAKLLVIDEAHGTESAILDQVDLHITRRHVTRQDFHFPTGSDQDALRDWARYYKLHLSMRLSKLNDSIRLSNRELRAREIIALQNEIERLETFVESEQEWFVDRTEKEIILKPFSATSFANRMVFSKGGKILLMSATILDFAAMQKALGIDPADCLTMAAPCTFPPENRRIIFVPNIGSMSRAHRDETMPRMIGAVNKIVAGNPGRKGIIHAHSFDLTQRLAEGIRGRDVLTHSAGDPPGRREAIIRQHKASLEPTVLVSPSMTEGLDLKDDESRWQVIAKVPYANLADPYIKARMERDPAWYAHQTALALIQACGRSVRHEQDWAITYILDSDFGPFFQRNWNLFPRWWKDAYELSGKKPARAETLARAAESNKQQLGLSCGIVRG